jgi:hypothetical protein
MTCRKCTAKTADGIALCERCQQTATYALTNIAAYYADLDRVPTSDDNRRRGNSAPDPTGVAAAAVRVDPVTVADQEVTNSLTTWARCLVDDRPGVGLPPARVPQLAPWLSDRLPSIVTLAWAGDMLADLLVSERLLKRVAQRARTGNYLGVCGNQTNIEVVHDWQVCGCSCHLGDAYVCDVTGGCGTDVVLVQTSICDRSLYAGHDDRWVTCGCGATWDARARRQDIVRAIEDQLAPVAIIARLAAAFAGEASVGQVEARIRKWAERKHIRHVTTKVIDGRERRVYRVGDVLDLLADTPEQKTGVVSA